MTTNNLISGAFVSLAAAALLAQGVLAHASGESSVTVVAHGPAGLRIEGRSSQVTSAQDGNGLTFEVPIAPIDTGIGLRNRHLRELLEADKFPAAILRIPRSGLAVPLPGQPAQATAKGELTLCGRARTLEVQYRAEVDKDGVARVRGSMQIDLRDFGLASPSYLGMTVSPQVEVDVDLTLGLE
ncbi:MAG: YceI family protein [Myxococcales bacterium]